MQKPILIQLNFVVPIQGKIFFLSYFCDILILFLFKLTFLSEA